MFSNIPQKQRSRAVKHINTNIATFNKMEELLIQGQLQQIGCFNGAYFLLHWSNWNSNITFPVNTFLIVLK